ncbi:DUF262 domain-containing protein [Pseudoxanthomonas sp. UC19_8]|uniref:DUF262 domain-containing protein n=1 Tax=Pseudoxanthomonas sp. UC19_8 TaxID=3350175 RepID=UPI0036D30855
MDANPRNLDDIFGSNYQYQIPLFQRPYVWEKDQWEPLWLDIRSHMARMVRKDRLLPHFMGAVVLERSPNPTGSLQIRSVIDGQQRFTTLQILLMAARDAAFARGQNDHGENFNSYVTNDRKVKDKRLKQKVYPSNADRDGFDAIHGIKSPEELDEKMKSNIPLANTNIICAYRFYAEQIANWADGADVDDFPAMDMDVENRFELLWNVCSMHLLLVVVDIDADKEDSQVIFETLNARGTPLLPADLIKNYLFRSVSQMEQYDEASLRELYDNNWKQFDRNSWRKLYRQGRLERPKIDTFINHYLSMRTRDDIRTGHLFVAFKEFCETALDGDGGIISPDTHIKDIARFAATFLKIVEPSDHPELKRFMSRLAAVDTATIYPFLLFAYDRLMPDNREAFNDVLGVLEAFLMRRMITDAGTKAYNRLFVELTKAVDRETGSPPFSRTLTRRPIKAMRSVHVEAKEVQHRVQARCG